MFPKQERAADAMEEQTVTAEVNIKIETLEGATSEEISSPFLENIAADSSFGDDPVHSSKMVANPAFFQHPLSSNADLEEGSNPTKNNPTGGGGSSFKFQGRVPKGHPSVVWMNQCQYDCKICVKKPFKSFTRAGFKSHLSNAHNLTIDEYKGSHGDIITVRMEHTCRICGSVYQHNSHSLTRHFSEMHSLTVVEYYQRHIKGTQGEVKGGKIPQNLSPEKPRGSPTSTAFKFTGRVPLGHPSVRWSNQCVYVCLICTDKPYKTYSASGFGNHLKSVHSMETFAYTSQFGSLMTERVHHTCRICRTPVVHQNQPLAYHFKSFHETTVIDYWKKYIQNSSETPTEDDSSVVMNNKKGQIPKHHPANRWVNQCEYDCRICVNSPFKAYSHGVFSGHLSKVHDMSIPEYTEKYGELVTVHKFHECRICNCSYIHNKPAISRHLETAHDGLSVVEYFNSFIEGTSLGSSSESGQQFKFGHRRVPKSHPSVRWSNQCEYQCQLCPKKCWSNSGLSKHLSNVHQKSNEEYVSVFQEMMTSRVYHDCLICGLQVLHNHSGLSRHLKELHEMQIIDYYGQFIAKTEPLQPSSLAIVKNPKSSQKISTSHPSYRWSNQCEYQCALCQKVFHNKSLMSGHLGNAHSMTASEYSEQHGELLTKKPLYQCQICDCEVTHSYSSLKYHFASTHAGMTVMDYYSQYHASEYRPPASAGDQMPAPQNHSSSELFHAAAAAVQGQDTQGALNTDAVLWANKCTHACKECTFSSNDYSQFCHHLQNAHKLKAAEYSKKYGLTTTITTRERHTCKICQKRVNHSRYAINQHAATHQMELGSYFENYIRREKEASEWSDQCDHPCKVCGSFNTKIYQKFVNHLKNVHNNTVMEYTQKFKTTVSTQTKHECRICQAEITHNSRTLDYHLKSRHSLDILTYYKQHINPIPGEVIKVEVKEEPLEIDVNEALVREEDAAVDANRALHEEAVVWADKCAFQCRICSEYSTNNGGHFYRHIRKEHNLGGGMYTERYGEHMTKKELHTCTLCGNVFNHTKGAIESHVFRVHSLALFEYYDIHILKNAAPLDTLAVKSEPGLEPLGDPSAKRIQTRRSDHRPGETKSESGSSQLQEVDESSFRKWVNKCRFDCKECGQAFSDRGGLSRHVTLAHCMTNKQYSSNHGSEWHTLKRYHECHICQSEVVHNYDCLKSHLGSTSHQHLSPREYYVIYVQGKEENVDAPAEEFPEIDGSNQGGGLRSLGKGERQELVAEFHDWMNQSVYSCQECREFETKNNNAWYTHIQAEHNLNGQDYRNRHGDPVSNKKVLNCMVCGASVSLNPNSLKSHFKGKGHQGVKLINYFRTYVHGKTEEEYQKAFENVNWSKLQTPQPKPKKKATPKKPTAPAAVTNHKGGKLIGSDKENSYWFRNSAEYSCQYEDCGSEFSAEATLCVHIAETHTGLQDYYECHGSYGLYTPSAKATCLICQCEVVKSPASVKKHLKAHRVDPAIQVTRCEPDQNTAHPMPEFSAPPSECEDSELMDVDSIEFLSSESEEDHDGGPSLLEEVESKPILGQDDDNSKAEISVSSPASDVESGTASTSSKMRAKSRQVVTTPPKLSGAGKRPLKIKIASQQSSAAGQSNTAGVERTENDSCEPTAKRARPAAETSQDSWMEGCTFACVLCEPKALFNSRDTLADHLKASHCVDMSVYIKLRDPTEELAFFKCLLCDEQGIRKEKQFVTEHITSKHGTTPDLYRAITAKLAG